MSALFDQADLNDLPVLVVKFHTHGKAHDGHCDDMYSGGDTQLKKVDNVFYVALTVPELRKPEIDHPHSESMRSDIATEHYRLTPAAVDKFTADISCYRYWKGRRITYECDCGCSIRTEAVSGLFVDPTQTRRSTPDEMKQWCRAMDQ